MAAFRCNAAMYRHRRAIRGVAPFTQLANVPPTNNIHTFDIISIVYSDQLGILGSTQPNPDAVGGISRESYGEGDSGQTA